MKDENYKQKNLGPIYAYPMGIWFTIFFIAPILIILAYSFLKKGSTAESRWNSRSRHSARC